VSAELVRRQVGRLRAVSQTEFGSALVPRFIALAFWIVLPSLCALMLVYGTDRLATHLNNIPPGIPGTYLVTSHSCSTDVCVTGGTFTSSDGNLVETNLLGNFSWQNGEKHKAIYDSNSVDVIPLPAHWDPTATYVGLAGSVGFLVLWSVFLCGAIRRRVVARAEGPYDEEPDHERPHGEEPWSAAALA
jgi:hypothetical protein